MTVGGFMVYAPPTRGRPANHVQDTVRYWHLSAGMDPPPAGAQQPPVLIRHAVQLLVRLD